MKFHSAEGLAIMKEREKDRRDDLVKHLEAKIHELDALNSDLTDLYNKHMKSWSEREKTHLARIRDLELQLGMVRW
jgi:hypothetical protein